MSEQEAGDSGSPLRTPSDSAEEEAALLEEPSNEEKTEGGEESSKEGQGQVEDENILDDLLDRDAGHEDMFKTEEDEHLLEEDDDEKDGNQRKAGFNISIFNCCAYFCLAWPLIFPN